MKKIIIAEAPHTIDNMDSAIMKQNIKGMSFSDLQNWCIGQGESGFRGIQLFEWMYRHGVSNPRDMLNIKKSFREHLFNNYIFETLSLAGISFSELEPTQKLLFKTHDNLFIETVSITNGERHTVCLSTQIGCNLKCRFCATGKMGFWRNLSSGEIVDQLIHVKKNVHKPVTNIVFMGMGEPFLNYDNVMKAADIFHHQRGFNLASDRITISTAGILPEIHRFIREKRKFNLAVSLNAADDATRSQIMPVNNKWSIRELVRAGKSYSQLPRRQIMFEYVLLNGVNDSPQDAAQLAHLLNGINCKVNIIPYNVSGGLYQRPDEQTVNEFAKILTEMRNTYRVLVRWSSGADIDAACGQLAMKSQNNNLSREYTVS